MEVWQPKSEARDPVSKGQESACGAWELRGEVWDLSFHQLPLNLTPGCSYVDGRPNNDHTRVVSP